MVFHQASSLLTRLMMESLIISDDRRSSLGGRLWLRHDLDDKQTQWTPRTALKPTDASWEDIKWVLGALAMWWSITRFVPGPFIRLHYDVANACLSVGKVNIPLCKYRRGIDWLPQKTRRHTKTYCFFLPFIDSQATCESMSLNDTKTDSLTVD